MLEVLRLFVKITRVSIVRFAFVMIMSVQASVSWGSRSFFDFHTGDRCSFERYCCITAVAPLLLHRFALFAASNCVQCRAFAPRFTQVFCDVPSRFAKGVKVAFLAINRKMETTRSSTNLGRRVPGCLVGEAQWFQDLIYDVIMCVVRGWACEVRCGYDDGHVEVGLFPLLFLRVRNSSRR